MSVQISSSETWGSPAEISLRWMRLREQAQGSDSVPLIAEGLPLRATRILAEAGALTVQDLLAMDPGKLVEQGNVGRSTMSVLLDRAESSLSPVSVVPATPDLVEVVDLLIDALPARARAVVLERFDRHTKSIEVGKVVGCSRERVRQIEEKFVRRIRVASRRYRLPLETVLDDDVIEFEEISSGRRPPRHPQRLYVSIARAMLDDADSYVDVERYYSSQIGILIREIKSDDAFLLGRFTSERAWQLVSDVTPALSELDKAELWGRICRDLNAIESGGTLVGRKPQVGRIIRALLREADGPVSVTLLVHQLRFILAGYGESSYFDEIRLRNKLVSMRDIHILGQHTVSIQVPDEPITHSWLEKVVKRIEDAGKPYSVLRFLEEHEDAPFDAFALHHMLRNDQRVVHVGRRLYAPSNYEKSGSIQVAALVTEALRKSGVSLTRRELLKYVQDRRDLLCRQIDNYFERVPSLVKYTNDIVGLIPLNRAVMLQMLMREPTVLSLLAGVPDDGPVHLSRLWLLSESDADLQPSEERDIITAARRWKAATAEVSSSGLFFDLREE